ncbi:hypothetical protein HMPREF0670_00990 [Prevotella sp. oral taxon 317 str. F0108]|nr:hypothetical protein HMPREF0670_00990 [Prevotella sp. oral taxon 317 str. F0108]
MSSPQQLTEDGRPWHAVRLFSLRLNEAMAYFTSAGLTCFVPMEWSGKRTGDDDGKPIFKPVVFNLVFVKKDKEECDLRRIFANARFKMSVIRKDKVAGTYYEIPSKQMLDFMLMCSPEIEMRKFLSATEAKLKSGTPVIVKHGPLKGLTGRLVRSSKKYFLLKEVPELGVMIKVSRWCCAPIEQQ